MTLSPLHAPPRSYVRRQGRLTLGQKRAHRDYGPLYRLEEQQGLLFNWCKVFGREAPCVLEIGFGMGESFVELARTHPEMNFIGVEVHAPGVGRCLHLIHHYQLTNVRVFQGDAKTFLIKHVSSHSLDKILLLFPDPWPKSRHQKRRLVQPDFALLVAQKLKKNGLFNAATDWLHYADHMLAVLEACSALQNCNGKNQFSPDRADRVKTKYERRGEQQGHAISDLVFRSILSPHEY